MYAIVYLSARKDTVFFLIDKEIIRCKNTSQYLLRIPFNGLSEFYVKNDVSEGLSKLATAS